VKHAASAPAGRRRRRGAGEPRAAAPAAHAGPPAARAAASAAPPPASPAADSRPPAAHAPAIGPAASPAADSRPAARPRLRQLPYLIVLCGAGLSLLSMRQGEQHVRSGTLELAGVLLVAAVARLLLPERRAGMLGSRRRLVDVAAFAALGLSLLVAGLVFPPPA
jgi:hypothetical protein